MSPRGQKLVIALGALLMAAVTARLGWWQLDRGSQKSALQAAIEQRARAPALASLPVIASDADASALHHRSIQVTGRWVADRTVYLDNRQMHGRPGFYVVTPLVLDDGRAVLVQRGWLPRDLRERTRVPEVPSASGVLTVAGRVAPPPGRLFEFDGADTGRIRQNLDLGSFARETGLSLVPLSIVQTGPTGGDGLQRDWPQPASGVTKHYGYAFQWFGLSALTVFLYVWFQFIQPRRRR